MRDALKQILRFAQLPTFTSWIAIGAFWPLVVDASVIDDATCRVVDGSINFGNIYFDRPGALATSGNVRLFCERQNDSTERTAAVSVFVALQPLTTQRTDRSSQIAWQIYDARSTAQSAVASGEPEQLMGKVSIWWRKGQRSVAMDFPLRALLRPSSLSDAGQYTGSAQVRIVVE